MKNCEFWKGVLAGVVAVVLIGSAGYMGYGYTQKKENDSVLSEASHTKKLKKLEDMIDTYYLGEKDEEKLAEGLYAGLLYGLGDPYSRYYTAEEYEAANSSNEGIYVGIGILMQKNQEGGVRIVECYQGGPGEEAGLLVDDIISAVDQTDITDFTVYEVADLIKGMDTDCVLLTIHREGEDGTQKISVPITDVELPSVFSEMLENNVGYIQITEFKGVTYEQYKNAFDQLSKEGMEKLIVDLRDNPGGLLTSVCDILEEILPEGIIVYTEDKEGNREEKRSEGQHTLEMPLAVLVNESSASASEIFAGAVQDYGVGTIVGTTTYGKGVVQSIRTLEDGSAVKLTVSNYYTPNGNNINEVGIQPDVEVKLSADLLGKEDISHSEDNQLQEAIKILK